MLLRLVVGQAILLWFEVLRCDDVGHVRTRKIITAIPLRFFLANVNKEWTSCRPSS
jgi:hypothetical protein